jgi:hypothetical protein
MSLKNVRHVLYKDLAKSRLKIYLAVSNILNGKSAVGRKANTTHF